MRRILVLLKILMARIVLIIEFCHDCGIRQPVYWRASDDLWDEFSPGSQKPLCPPCFDRRAANSGVLLRWVPLKDGKTASAGHQVADCKRNYV